jgi:fibro-slime domain-containing protein
MAEQSRALHPRLTAALATVFLVALGARCGGRTGLPLPEPCDDPGHARGCRNLCGAGTQVCERGYWQSCTVPPTSRACSNTCGAGEERCVDDAWLACSVPPAKRACSSVCGPGTETCTADAWGPCDAPLPGPPTLHAVVRNVLPSDPDFLQSCCSGGNDPGIVASMLGSDGTPVYAGTPTTLTTHGQADFAAWYHDVSGVNLSTSLDLPMTVMSGQPGFYTFQNAAFFPVDNQLFGDQGAAHNFDFTLEAHAQILYGGGETYFFSSDDDLWVFINGRLAVDLGGLHAAMDASVDLDQMAGQLGIAPGQMFPLDLFYADREPPQADLQISVPTTDLWSCP